MRTVTALLLSSVLFSSACELAEAQHQVDRESAVAALHQAVGFYRENVSVEGGSVYAVSADLSKREGENAVGNREAWIQPPATPAVGMVYLRGWQLTGDDVLKDALVEVCEALIKGQLESGGWANNIEFDSRLRGKYAYRVDASDSVRNGFNRSTFDDNKSQSALRCLMLADQEFSFRKQVDPRGGNACLGIVHESSVPQRRLAAAVRRLSGRRRVSRPEGKVP